VESLQVDMPPLDLQIVIEAMGIAMIDPNKYDKVFLGRELIPR